MTFSRLLSVLKSCSAAVLSSVDAHRFRPQCLKWSCTGSMGPNNHAAVLLILKTVLSF